MLNVSLHHNLRTVSGYSIGRIKKKNHNTIFGLNRLLKKKKKQKIKTKTKIKKRQNKETRKNKLKSKSLFHFTVLLYQRKKKSFITQ